jgi:hypothetical protein
MSMRIGQGFDSHAFKAGYLCVLEASQSIIPRGWPGTRTATCCCMR